MPPVRVDREPPFKLSLTTDIERIWREHRFAGFDLYEFFHLARATPDGRRLVPVQDRMRRIRRKARALGLVEN